MRRIASTIPPFLFPFGDTVHRMVFWDEAVGFSILSLFSVHGLAAPSHLQHQPGSLEAAEIQTISMGFNTIILKIMFLQPHFFNLT